MRHKDFALDDDQISHGARLWANLLSLMATNAWLEQKHRRTLQLQEDTLAIEARPEDYEVAYKIFNAVCKRTVVNLSDTHRKILDGVYKLMYENPERDGFSQREIAKAAGVSQSMVSENKTYLVTSAKLLTDTDYGLVLVSGAEPSWWAEGDVMKGVPTPKQVRQWWEERDPPPEGPDHADQPDHPDRNGPNPHTYAENGDRLHADQSPISDRRGEVGPRVPIAIGK